MFGTDGFRSVSKLWVLKDAENPRGGSNGGLILGKSSALHSRKLHKGGMKAGAHPEVKIVLGGRNDDKGGIYSR